MSRNHTTPQAGLLFMLLCLSHQSVCAQRQPPAFVLDLTSPLSCAAHWDLSMQNMYKLAYKWTHEHKLNDWRYSEIKREKIHYDSNNTRNDLKPEDCVLLSYKTFIEIPSFFNSYLASHVLPMGVSKTVCASRQHMHEHVVFSDLLVIGSFDIDLNATIAHAPQHLSVAAASVIAIPWYLTPIRDTVLKHIKESLVQYIGIMADQLCE
jgi:hypothetical protein